MFGRHVGDGECEGTQAVEADDPGLTGLIVDGDESPRHVAFLVLSDKKIEPIIELATPHENAVRSRSPSGSIDFDHARSAEKFTMTFQRFDNTTPDQAPGDRREEGVAIRSRQHHAMLAEEPPHALMGKIAGGKDR